MNNNKLIARLQEWATNCLIDGMKMDRGEPTLQELLADAAARLQGDTRAPMGLTTSMVEMSSTGRQKMAGKVIINGKSVDFDAAVNLMDDEIREHLHSTVADYNQDDPKSHQNFVDAYCVAHSQRFGEDFQVA